MNLPYLLFEQLTEVLGCYTTNTKSDSPRVRNGEYKSLIGYNSLYDGNFYYCYGDHPIPNNFVGDMLSARGYLHYSLHKWIIYHMQFIGNFNNLIESAIIINKINMVAHLWEWEWECYIIWNTMNIKLIRTMIHANPPHKSDGCSVGPQIKYHNAGERYTYAGETLYKLCNN